ncbi:MAG: hypothetical protein IKS83_08645, partial [Victivallales bacterium]|nr:hypothetical protein [Victivallales bacterium]
MKLSALHRCFLLCSVFLLAWSSVTAFAIQPPRKDEVPQPSLPDLRVVAYEFDSCRSIHLTFKGEMSASQYDPSLIEVFPQTDVSFQNTYWGNSYRIIGDFQPGEVYQVTLKAGFPLKDAACHLEEDFVMNLICPDLPARLRFASNGTFFPLHAPIWELPLQSTNITEKMQCTVHEAYPNTLLNHLKKIGSYYYDESFRWTRQISSQQITLPYLPNQRIASKIDLAEIGIPRDRPGVYVIKIVNPHRNWDTETRDIIVTDLALFVTANGGEYLCQVRSLEHPDRPLPGVQLELFSRKFQTLAKGTTDAQGEARLRVLPQEDAENTPMILLAHNPQDNDLAYLDFTSPHIDSFGNFTTIKDSKAPQGYLFADRGAVLPGEELTFTALLRDPGANRPLADLPLEFALFDARMNTVITQLTTTDEYGALQCAVRLSQQAPLGIYTASLKQPGDHAAFASTSVLVANFVPDQLTARLDLPAQIPPQESLEVALQANYYFGAPVKNAQVMVNATFSWLDIIPPDNLREFHFGIRPETYAEPQPQKLTTVVDATGKASFNLALPQLANKKYHPALPLRIQVQANVQPYGVRGVTTSAVARFDDFDYYLGSRVLQEEPTRVRLQFVALDPQSKVTALPEEFTVNISRLSWEYLLMQQSDDSYRRVWQMVQNEIATLTAHPDQDGCVWAELPSYGNYLFSVKNSDGQVMNELCHWHYSGESGERSASPARLDFVLDASQYRPGQTAHITFDSDFAGTCLVVSGSHHTPMLTASQPLEVGENTLDIAIPEWLCQTHWFVGVTAVGTIGMDAAGAPQDAQFLSGIARLDIEQNANRLAIDMNAPDQAQPGGQATLELTLRDAVGNPVAGEVVLWAVDEGILALTGYQTPDAFKAFFDNSEYPFELGSIYPELYPMLRVVNGEIGGGYGISAGKAADFQGKLANDEEPPHFVQLGLLRTDESGHLNTTISLPKFAGMARLMACATDATTRLGGTQKDIVLRDAITLTLVAPRVAAPGDTLLLRGAIFNHDLENAQLSWSFGRLQEGFRPATGEVTLAKGESAPVSVRLAIPEDTAEGALPVLLTAETADGQRFEKRTVITIRSAIPPQPVCDTLLLHPGEETTFELSGQATDLLRVGSPVIRLMRHWEWLNDYPHGCLEQITATAFPQLAIPDLVASGRLPEHLQAGAKQVVNTTLGKYHSYLTANQWYSMWPNEHGKAWEEGSLFAFLFQAEADRAGFTMPRKERLQVVKLLRIFFNDRTKNQVERALALYTLSLLSPTYVEKYAQMLPLDKRDCQPFTTFLTAMALIRGGYAAEGNELWRRIADQEFTRVPAKTSMLDSEVRRTGLALWILADLLPEAPQNRQLAATLDSLAQTDTYFTTQEHAWYALGISKYLLTRPPPQGESSFAAVLTDQDGVARDLDFTKDAPVEVNAKGTYTLRNTGTEPLNVQHSFRARSDAAKDISAGLQISRAYLAADGSPVSSCRAGDLLTVRILLSGGAVQRIVISDLLPAGFEIEDENLLTRFNLPAGGHHAENTPEELVASLIEKRFDRLLWFGDFPGADIPLQVTYQVRAVT